MELEIIKVLDIFLPFIMTFNATIARNSCQKIQSTSVSTSFGESFQAFEL
jgi:hypothetical protein